MYISDVGLMCTISLQSCQIGLRIHKISKHVRKWSTFLPQNEGLTEKMNQLEVNLVHGMSIDGVSCP